MLKFNEYYNLNEKLITFGKTAYPKFGHVVILAGGAGSGKGFIKERLLGLEGFSMDVDDLKKLASRAPRINHKVKTELGIDLTKLGADLRNPDSVSKIHDIVGTYLELDSKKLNAIYKSILTAHKDRKPNIIFDVTLKSLSKLEKLTKQVKSLGYDNDKVHIVWVVNDIEVAKTQNSKRDRVVPGEILVNTHRGASQTMADILNMGKALSKYMDGMIVLAFNKVGVDSSLLKSGKGGSFIKDANYFIAKVSGKPPVKISSLERSVRQKIHDYVPKTVDWI